MKDKKKILKVLLEDILKISDSGSKIITVKEFYKKNYSLLTTMSIIIIVLAIVGYFGGVIGTVLSIIIGIFLTWRLPATVMKIVEKETSIIEK